MVESIRRGDIPGVQLRCRQQLAATPTEVWSWLTEADRLARWLASRAEADPSPDGGFSLESASEAGDVVHERGETLELVPERRWVLGFQPLEDDWPVATRLTLELSRSDIGCELSVLQTGFAHLPLSDCLTIWETYRRRWRTALAQLARLIAEG